MVVENDKLPRVSISLRFDNEPFVEKNKAGVLNLISKMMGKGSKKIPKNNFEEEIDFMGASLNFTSSNASGSCLSRFFPRFFKLIADATLNPKFLEEEFEKEKEKLLESLKANENDVKANARKVENILLYGKLHPNGEFASEKTINDITLDDIKKLYYNRFNPENCYVIIVGDISFQKAKKMTTELMGDWKGREKSISKFPKAKNFNELEIAFVEMPNAVQSEISVLRTMEVNRNSKDYFSLLIANQILGGGAEARLFMNLREDKGYTYGSYSRLSISNKTKSRIRAFAAVRNQVTDSAAIEILSELERISKEPVSNSELNLVKKKYAGSLIRSMEDPGNIANFAYNIKTEELPLNFYNDLLKNIEKISPQDITNVSKKYLRSKNMLLVITGKGADILESIEEIEFNERKLKVNYYNKDGYSIDRPKYDN